MSTEFREAVHTMRTHIQRACNDAITTFETQTSLMPSRITVNLIDVSTADRTRRYVASVTFTFDDQ